MPRNTPGTISGTPPTGSTFNIAGKTAQEIAKEYPSVDRTYPDLTTAPASMKASIESKGQGFRDPDVKGDSKGIINAFSNLAKDPNLAPIVQEALGHLRTMTDASMKWVGSRSDDDGAAMWSTLQKESPKYGAALKKIVDATKGRSLTSGEEAAFKFLGGEAGLTAVKNMKSGRPGAEGAFLKAVETHGANLFNSYDTSNVYSGFRRTELEQTIDKSNDVATATPPEPSAKAGGQGNWIVASSGHIPDVALPNKPSATPTQGEPSNPGQKKLG